MPANALPSIGYAISAAGKGRMSLPVSSSSYIYSHFRHVSGVPAPEGVRGAAINKLKVLDTLIEQLARMKKRPEPSFGLPEESSGDRYEALVAHFEKQIRLRAKDGEAYGPPAVRQGAVFSLSV
jgi:hypothetical protein